MHRWTTRALLLVGFALLGACSAHRVPSRGDDDEASAQKAPAFVEFCGVRWVMDTTAVTCHEMVTTNDLAELARLKWIRWLDLRGASVTDRGVKHLAQLKALRNLNLKGADVTDVGLGYLGRLQALEFIYLQDTLVTEAGVRKLKRALPTTYVGR